MPLVPSFSLRTFTKLQTCSRAMAFWGVEVKSGSPFTHYPNNGNSRLHVSQATLGSGTLASSSKCLVQCNVGNRSPVLLCSLFPGATESCQLNLEFEEADKVIFSVIGSRSVHLTGYYLSRNWNYNLNNESETYGEDIGGSDTERSENCGKDDEYEDSFIDDREPEVFPDSPTTSNEVPEVGKKRRRLRRRLEICSSDDDDGINEKKNDVAAKKDEDVIPIPQKVDTNGYCDLERQTGKSISASHTGTSPQNTGDQMQHSEELPKKIRSSEEIVEDFFRGAMLPLPRVSPRELLKDNSLSFTQQINKGLNANGSIPKPAENPKKKKKDEYTGETNWKIYEHEHKHDDEEHHVGVADSLLKSEDQEQSGNFCKTSVNAPKQSKKKKVYKMNEQVKTGDEERTFGDEDKNELDNRVHTSSVGKKRKHRTREQEISQKADTATAKPTVGQEEYVSDTCSDTMPESSSNRTTFPNGLVIEEISLGRADDKVAISGKKVSIRYACVSNNSEGVLDSSADKTHLKFRLGGKNVAEFWSIGVEGMRKGGKRRLLVPPSLIGEEEERNMGGDALFVYDVEMLKIRP